MHYCHLEPVRANTRSSIVYFRKPADKIVHRYTLATKETEHNGQSVSHAHVVVMPHVGKKILDRFLEDLGGNRI